MDDLKNDLSEEDVDTEYDKAHAGADPFKDHGTQNKSKEKNTSNNNEEEDDDAVLRPQEGFNIDETRPGSDDLSSANLLSGSKSDEENDLKNTKDKNSLFRGKRPTSAGEPSANVPPRFDVSVTCEIRWVVAFLTFLFFLMTMFDSVWIENGFVSMLHWTNDRQTGLGAVAFIFSIFDCCLLMVAGGADIMLMLGSGFLFGFEVGSGIYMVCAFIASVICFIIGKSLYRDAWYRLWSKHEIFRLSDRTIQDFGGWLTFSLRLCPFLPMGFVAYLLSFTSVTLKQFMLGHLLGSVTSVAAIALAGSRMDSVNDVTLNAYTKDPLTYAVVVGVSVLFALSFSLVSFLIYRQIHRLLTGDNRDNRERSLTESEESVTENESEEAGKNGNNDVDLEAGDNALLDNDEIGGNDIEMAQYNISKDNNNIIGNKLDKDSNNKDNGSGKKKKRKKKKKKSSNNNDKKKAFGWDDDMGGLGTSPFSEGGAPRGKFGQQPMADLDAAPMDPTTPRK